MRFLHLADLHLGKIVNGFNMRDDQRFALEHILQRAHAEHVDAVVLAGDLYDKSQPSAEAVALFDWFLTALAQASLPCLAIPGNHDSAARVSYARQLLRDQGIVLAPIYDGTLCRWTAYDANGPVNFWLLPFVRPIDVKHAFPDHADAIGQDYTAALACALDACAIDTTERNVLVAHQFVTYAHTEPQRSDSELAIGGLDAVDGRVFDNFDYVALGHIHRPQQIGRPEMRYAGSLLKYSYSEARYAKSAVLVEMGPKGSVATTLVPIVSKHDLREIKGTVAELTSETALAAAAAAGCSNEDYIHALLTDKAPSLTDREQLRHAYPNLMGYEYLDSRADAPGIGAAAERAEPQRLDPSTLFLQFFQEMNGQEPSDAQSRIVQEQMAAVALATDEEA